MSNKQYHVMIDIETLGTRPNALVTEIGAVAFLMDEDTPRYNEIRFHEYLVLEGQKGSVDTSTVQWWLKQSDSARMGYANSEGIRPVDALNRLSDWFRTIECVGDIVGVWSHGPAFDITILSNLYNTCPPDYMLFRLPPWNYRTIRDTRTLVFALEAAGLPVPPYPADGTAHNALDDARNQAVWVKRMYGTLLGEDY